MHMRPARRCLACAVRLLLAALIVARVPAVIFLATILGEEIGLRIVELASDHAPMAIGRPRFSLMSLARD